MRDEKKELSCAFTVAGKRVKVEYRTRPLQVKQTIDLKPVPAGACEHSLVGECTGSLGQCYDGIEDAALATADPRAADVRRLCALWKVLHLNGMRAGTRAQETALRQAPATVGKDYDSRLAYLAECGLNPDRNTAPGEPYKYGTAWLYDPVMDSDVEELRALMARLDGVRMAGHMDTPEESEDGDSDVPSVPDEAEFSNSDAVIDSRDVIARVETLRDYKEAGGTDEDALHELKVLEDLESQASGYAADWQHGESLIRESYFEEYAKEFAQDCGMIKDDAQWPNNCICWESAAEELKQDYTSVEFDGVTYLVR